MAQNTSPLYQLVAAKIGGDPVDYINTRRQPGNTKSFNTIAQELSQATGMPITYEWVRRTWRATPQGTAEQRPQWVHTRYPDSTPASD